MDWWWGAGFCEADDQWPLVFGEESNGLFACWGQKYRHCRGGEPAESYGRWGCDWPESAQGNKSAAEVLFGGFEQTMPCQLARQTEINGLAVASKKKGLQVIWTAGRIDWNPFASQPAELHAGASSSPSFKLPRPTSFLTAYKTSKSVYSHLPGPESGRRTGYLLARPLQKRQTLSGQTQNSLRILKRQSSSFKLLTLEADDLQNNRKVISNGSLRCKAKGIFISGEEGGIPQRFSIKIAEDHGEEGASCNLEKAHQPPSNLIILPSILVILDIVTIFK